MQHRLSRKQQRARRTPSFQPFAAVAAIVLLALTTASSAHAQAFARVEQTETNVPSYYHFVEPGAATVQVYVLGSAGAPGVYELTDGTDLGKLLALSRATVGSVGVNNADGGITERDAVVRLYRPQGDTRTMIYESDMKDVIQSLREYPVLRDGDVLSIEVKERSKFGWRDVLRIAQVAAVIGLAFDRFANN